MTTLVTIWAVLTIVGMCVSWPLLFDRYETEDDPDSDYCGFCGMNVEDADICEHCWRDIGSGD